MGQTHQLIIRINEDKKNIFNIQSLQSTFCKPIITSIGKNKNSRSLYHNLRNIPHKTIKRKLILSKMSTKLLDYTYFSIISKFISYSITYFITWKKEFFKLITKEDAELKKKMLSTAKITPRMRRKKKGVRDIGNRE